MHKTIRVPGKKLLIMSLFAIFTAQVYSQSFFDYGFEFSTVGTSGMNFMKIGSGARSAGIAMTGTGLIGQAENLFHNPAGIAFISSPDLSFSTNSWLAGSVQHSIAVAVPVRQMVFGLTVLNFNISDIEETTVSEPLGTGNMISAGDLQLGLSLAKQFTDKLGIGGQIKWVRETLAEYESSNILIDLGATYFMGYKDIRVSFVFQHFGPDIQVVEQTLRMPLIFRVGLTGDLIKTSKSQLLMSLELSHPTDNLEQVAIGLEYTLLNRLSLRTGYRIFTGGDDDLLDVDHRATDENRLVLGFGINAYKGINLDYALVPHGDAMGDIHHFTAGFNF